ncbi:hypothetical protein D3C86_1783640 [compost metagenome]
MEGHVERNNLVFPIVQYFLRVATRDFDRCLIRLRSCGTEEYGIRTAVVCQ